MDRKIYGEEQKYVQGLLLALHNDGSGFNKFIYLIEIIIDITFINIAADGLSKFINERNIGTLVYTIIIFLLACILTVVLVMIFYHSVIKKEKRILNQAIMNNQIYVYDVLLVDFKRTSSKNGLGPVFATAVYSNGLKNPGQFKCNFYDLEKGYQQGLKIDICDSTGKQLAFDLIPLYIPGSKTDRISKRGYRKYSGKI